LDLEQIVTEFYADVFRFAMSLAQDEHVARDLTQEAFRRLAANAGRVTDPGRAKSWLFTTLYREFLAGRRYAQRFFAEAADPGSEPLAELTVEFVHGLDAEAVMAALGDLSEAFRAPVALFYLEDLTYAEIAETLGIPLGTVMSRLARGKAMLRNQLLAVRPKGAPHPPARCHRPELVQRPLL
jgi:RNA polymerase sigma-70 factor (ECF subfamily)